MKSLTAAAAALLFSATLSAAAELPHPAGPVILEISGLIANTNLAGNADFDMAMLNSIESRTTTTSAPWYDGAHAFSGPLGSAVLNEVGASGTMLRVTALNDYVTEIPVSDFMDYRVVLATALDGQVLSVRDKGPIFIIYPFDESPELNNETYYGRSAWQVKSIEVY
ncbi:MAG: hypothetical protein ABL879_17155 [Devosia sp.]